VGPNLLHLVLLASAPLCVALTLREVRHRPLKPGRLAAPLLAAGACALVLFLMEVGTANSPWPFAAALAAGLLAGAVHGFTMQLQVDQMYATVRLPRARGSFYVALGLVAAVLIEVAGAIAGSAGSPFRMFAPEIAALCTGVLAGRLAAIMIRWRYEPHVDLHRM
jgi:hypothetical protein